MSAFYTSAKIWFRVGQVLFSLFLIPLCLYSIFTGQLPMAILYGCMEGFALGVTGWLLHYYGNLVTGVSFDGDMTLIETNVEDYRLPSAQFYEVVDACSMGRILLRYADEKGKRTFVFQKQYSPVHRYTLELQELREHMICAKFTKS